MSWLHQNCPTGQHEAGLAKPSAVCGLDAVSTDEQRSAASVQVLLKSEAARSPESQVEFGQEDGVVGGALGPAGIQVYPGAR